MPGGEIGELGVCVEESIFGLSERSGTGGEPALLSGQEGTLLFSIVAPSMAT